MEKEPKEKIMVTGGAGFIGSHVVDLLIQQGYRVIVVDDLSGGKKEHLNRMAHFYQVDINDPGLEKIFQEEKPEYVCHLAAQISVSYSVGHPRFDAQQNIMGLLNILNCASKNRVKGIVFSSSGGTVYGEPDIFPLKESCPFFPSSPYGIAKMTSEYYLDFYQRFYDLNYLSLRFANVYGPRQDPFGEAGVISIFTQKMFTKEIPTINGDGEYIRDYVYVEDVAFACLLSIQNMLKLSRLRNNPHWPGSFCAFNIGTGVGSSVNQLYDLLQDVMNHHIEAHYGPPRPGDLRKNVLNCQAAKEMLNWEAKNDLKSGLIKTIEWFKKKN